MARGWLRASEGPELAGELALAALVDTNNSSAIRSRDETRLRAPRSAPVGDPGRCCADNIKSLAMVFAAVESARTRTRQAIEALP